MFAPDQRNDLSKPFLVQVDQPPPVFVFLYRHPVKDRRRLGKRLAEFLGVSMNTPEAPSNDSAKAPEATGPFAHTLLVGAEFGNQDTDNARIDNVFADSQDDRITIALAFSTTDWPARRSAVPAICMDREPIVPPPRTITSVSP